jgi:hypothetical protein
MKQINGNKGPDKDPRKEFQRIALKVAKGLDTIDDTLLNVTHDYAKMMGFGDKQGRLKLAQGIVIATNTAKIFVSQNPMTEVPQAVLAILTGVHMAKKVSEKTSENESGEVRKNDLPEIFLKMARLSLLFCAAVALTKTISGVENKIRSAIEFGTFALVAYLVDETNGRWGKFIDSVKERMSGLHSEAEI